MRLGQCIKVLYGSHLLVHNWLGAAECLAKRRQHDIQLQFSGGWTAFASIGGHIRWQFLERSEVDNKVVLDSKDSVGLEPRVVLGVDLRDARLVTRFRDHQARRSSANVET